MKLVPRWWKVPPLKVRIFCLLMGLGMLAWGIYLHGQHH